MLHKLRSPSANGMIGMFHESFFSYLLQISLTAFPPLCCVFVGQYEELSGSRQPRKYSHQDLLIRNTSHLKEKQKEVSR